MTLVAWYQAHEKPLAAIWAPLHTFLELFELIHFPKNLIVTHLGVLLRMSPPSDKRPSWQCLLHSCTSDKANSATHKSFVFVNGYHDLLYIQLWKAYSYELFHFWIPLLFIASTSEMMDLYATRLLSFYLCSHDTNGARLPTEWKAHESF